jgi:hypothetical protein
MPLERLEGLVVDRLEVAILALEPDAEVNDGVEVESGHLGVVPAADEPPPVLPE